ncbi:MAG TPA: hypothetical protein VM737_04280 [Gemmatimonadota bacterium]|nr:hypothetical protein [Gemmatimonadota bacterium]
MSALWKDRSSRPLRHEDPDDAIAGYMERLRQADVSGTPPPPSALNGLGDAYLDKDDVQSAIDYYRQAAEAYAQAGLHDNAIACCRKILRHAAESSAARLLLGRTYAAKGLRADALAELESLADRLAGSEDRKAAIAALVEIVRLAPERGERRAQLAGLLVQDGQGEAAIAEYRAAAAAFVAGGDPRAADGIRQRLAELERAEATAGAAQRAPGAASGGTLSQPPPPRPTPPPSKSPVSPPARPRPATGPAEPSPQHRPEVAGVAASNPVLEIEHTSYSDREAARSVEDASALARAAETFRQDHRWADAIEAYRGLAGMGRATPDDFSAWAECARQMGEPAKVLEALSCAARWHLEGDDVPGARAAAEEMLLIDPRNATASEVLERIGSLPRE